MDLGLNSTFFILIKCATLNKREGKRERKNSLHPWTESPELHADWTTSDQCPRPGKCHMLIGLGLSYLNQSWWKSGREHSDWLRQVEVAAGRESGCESFAGL